ncbi:hypothetical protein [Pseudomonas sp. SST3]|uniref:hypothetical protein n=1 Tax=Pseudomonas sp. SST3 TaxID=2267882 RepID=UPI003139CE1E
MTATAEDISYRNIPEPGQLVEVRRRQWVVAEVDASKLGSVQQNAVTLASIDEDALGEELQVIWEIEPGAHVIERAGLPAITGQDDSNTLEAFLDAVRWGAATNADRGFLQAPFRSGVSIQDFQLDPLVRAIDMARVNLLIADDVGLWQDDRSRFGHPGNAVAPSYTYCTDCLSRVAARKVACRDDGKVRLRISHRRWYLH